MIVEIQRRTARSGKLEANSVVTSKSDSLQKYPCYGIFVFYSLNLKYAVEFRLSCFNRSHILKSKNAYIACSDRYSVHIDLNFISCISQALVPGKVWFTKVSNKS